MPSSPATPSRSHRRRPSSIEIPSPSTHMTNGLNSSTSPRTARMSGNYSPQIPRQHSRRKTSASASMSSDGGYPVLREETGGMGNLADELADAWGEEDMDQSGVYLGNVEEHISESARTGDGAMEFHDMHDFGFGSPLGPINSPLASPTKYRQENHLLLPSGRRSPKKSDKHRYHHRADSAYDGSDYGDQSDLELEEGISPTLAARIADIEALGRLGKGDTGFEGDEVIQRTICSLRDLGAQSGIENGASRLMTAHASLSSHLSHQTRTIQTLTHSIIKTPFPDLDTPSLDQLISMTSDLLPLLPFPPQPSPLQSLQLLISSTAEITHLLRALSDTLQESRLVTNTASRRLKTVKDMVSDLRKEEEERDFGSAWIERGNWDEKLRNRDAKKICGEVVSGFESTCDTWRERLIGGAVGA